MRQIYVLQNTKYRTAHRICLLTSEERSQWNKALEENDSALRWIECAEFYRTRRSVSVEIQAEDGSWHMETCFASLEEAERVAAQLGGRVAEKVMF